METGRDPAFGKCEAAGLFAHNRTGSGARLLWCSAPEATRRRRRLRPRPAHPRAWRGVRGFRWSGQGAREHQLKMRPDYEVVLRAVVDYIVTRKDIDACFAPRRRRHIVRRSLRVPRCGVRRTRTRGGVGECVVYARGFVCAYAAAWANRDQAVLRAESCRRTGSHHDGGRSGAHSGAAAASLRRADKASSPREAYRVEKEVKGPCETVVFDEGVHVCNNVQNSARPLIADWLQQQLEA